MESLHRLVIHPKKSPLILHDLAPLLRTLLLSCPTCQLPSQGAPSINLDMPKNKNDHAESWRLRRTAHVPAPALSPSHSLPREECYLAPDEFHQVCCRTATFHFERINAQQHHSSEIGRRCPVGDTFRVSSAASYV